MRSDIEKKIMGIIERVPDKTYKDLAYSYRIKQLLEKLFDAHDNNNFENIDLYYKAFLHETSSLIENDRLAVYSEIDNYLFNEKMSAPILFDKITKNYSSVDLLIVTALYDPELTSMLKLLESYEEIEIPFANPNRLYTCYIGIMHTKIGLKIKVAAIFQDKMGLTDCSALTANCIHVFKPKLICMSGVCAGRKEMKVNICDIIMPSSIFTYDTGKYGQNDFKHEPLWEDVDSGIIRRARIKASNIVQEIYEKFNSSAPYRSAKPKVHFDIMACGSSVIDRKEKIDEIGDMHRKVVGFDMESYALIRSVKLTDNTIPVFVVKSVMDFGYDKSDSDKDMAAAWAANFLYHYIQEEFQTIIVSTP